MSPLLVQFLWWAGFSAVVAAMLVIDLRVAHRHPHEVRGREALVWSAVWIAVALAFNLGVYLVRGHRDGVDFLTAYVVEKALAVDNLFVFAAIFSHMAVPGQYQHRVLYWGVLGAIVLRAAMILAGIALLSCFHFMFIVFGAFLVFTGARLFIHRHREPHPEKSRVVGLTRRILPVTDGYREHRFLVREGGRLLATPLFVVLVLVEASDVVFAVDSVPAVLGITTDTFVAFTSNIFAILGLRSLYFLLASAMRRFEYLKYGLSLILVFIGVKMMVTDVEALEFLHKTYISLGVVLAILVVSAAASLYATRRRA